MPLFDYECPEGHKTEHFLSAFAETHVCGEEIDGGPVGVNYCREVAEYRPSFWYTSSLGRKAQGFAPVVIHTDADGNVRLPAHPDAPMPPGFKKVLLTDINQIRKFENDMNKVERAKMEDHAKNKIRNMNGQLAENRRAMSEIIKKFSPRGRKFYEAMRTASEIKQKKFAERGLQEPNFHIEAFSQDASNREQYRDKANDWGRLGGRSK